VGFEPGIFCSGDGRDVHYAKSPGHLIHKLVVGPDSVLSSIFLPIPGLPDFSWRMIPKQEKMVTKYPKYTLIIPNGHKI
jgi:hypothetical protein